MFGLNPAEVLRRDAVPSLWWGARAIYKPGPRLSVRMIDILPDRQQMSAYENNKACKALSSWINRKGLPKLRRELHARDIGTGDNRLIMIKDAPFYLIANPRASYGYIYLGAWKAEPWQTEATAPSTGNPPT